VPTYSYRCTECGTAFDIKQSFSDDALTECPTCGGVLRKVFSPVGVTFNGSGFYRTDSRAKPSEGGSGGSSGSGGSGGSGSGSGGGSSSSETKSAPSTPSKPSTPSTGGGSTSSSKPAAS
jgi:putative FmdB family regulatory protein